MMYPVRFFRGERKGHGVQHAKRGRGKPHSLPKSLKNFGEKKNWSLLGKFNHMENLNKNPYYSHDGPPGMGGGGRGSGAAAPHAPAIVRPSLTCYNYIQNSSTSGCQI